MIRTVCEALLTGMGLLGARPAALDVDPVSHLVSFSHVHSVGEDFHDRGARQGDVSQATFQSASASQSVQEETTYSGTSVPSTMTQR